VLAADALMEAKLIDPGKIPRAAQIIAEEIWVRLNLGDFPDKVST
jgi:hypothetical protein